MKSTKGEILLYLTSEELVTSHGTQRPPDRYYRKEKDNVPTTAHNAMNGTVHFVRSLKECFKTSMSDMTEYVVGVSKKTSNAHQRFLHNRKLLNVQ